MDRPKANEYNDMKHQYIEVIPRPVQFPKIYIKVSMTTREGKQYLIN